VSLRITHMVFGYSAAGDVKAALKLSGRDDSVVKFPDDLSYGPIDSTEWSARRAWVEENIGSLEGFGIADLSNFFWHAILDSDTQLIVWVSRRSAREYCGFLEYLRRLGERPSLIIETTEAKGPDGKFFGGTAAIPADQIASSGLLDSAINLPPELRARGQILWQSLREENAPLRALSRGLSLTSVPISFYDDALLSFVTADWTPMARVVGATLADEWDSGVSNVSDFLLFSRLHVLLETGVLEERPSARRHPDIRLVHA
jgi:hypothetical protein